MPSRVRRAAAGLLGAIVVGPSHAGGQEAELTTSGRLSPKRGDSAGDAGPAPAGVSGRGISLRETRSASRLRGRRGSRRRHRPHGGCDGRTIRPPSPGAPAVPQFSLGRSDPRARTRPAELPPLLGLGEGVCKRTGAGLSRRSVCSPRTAGLFAAGEAAAPPRLRARRGGSGCRLAARGAAGRRVDS